MLTSTAQSVINARAIMNTKAFQTKSAARYANWYWRVTNQVAGLAVNEERKPE
jgi:hypothetical protein